MRIEDLMAPATGALGDGTDGAADEAALAAAMELYMNDPQGAEKAEKVSTGPATPSPSPTPSPSLPESRRP